jgi:hypothetical protein
VAWRVGTVERISTGVGNSRQTALTQIKPCLAQQHGKLALLPVFRHWPYKGRGQCRYRPFTDSNSFASKYL